MTNAEKLAQNTELITEMLYSYCEKRERCAECHFNKVCDEHLLSRKDAVEWLEQEVKE